MNKDRELVMIFVKNPEKGKVKTRLAKTVGDQRALEVYRDLLNYTHEMVQPLEQDKQVYYSTYVDTDDIWENNLFHKHSQSNGDLGEKMEEAFRIAFDKGYKRVIIIGSDCAELRSTHLQEAFSLLKEKDACIGPAQDGGYYLLGLSSFVPELFRNKKWSTENVMLDTINDLSSQNLSYALLETLVDLDHESDLGTLYSEKRSC